MNIQQIIIIIIMTAFISVAVGMMTSSKDTFTKVLTYGAVMFAWAFLVVTIDLYISIAKLRQDVNTYMVK